MYTSVVHYLYFYKFWCSLCGFLVPWFPQSTVCTCLHSMTLHTAVIEGVDVFVFKGKWQRSAIYWAAMSHSGPGVFCFFLSNTNYSLSGSSHIYILPYCNFREREVTLWIAESSGKLVSNLLFLGSCNIALSIIENQESCLVSILSF